jgi:hypothetical protein
MDRVSFGVGAAVQTGDRAPRFDVVDTDYGSLIGARRTQPDGSWYWRVTQFLLPFYTMPPVGIGEKVVQSHIWVPMDDTHVVNWMVTWHLDRPLTREEIALHIEGKGAHVCDFAPATSEPYGDIRTAANRDNDYFMDWDAHRTRMFCGIPGFGAGPAIQETRDRSSIVASSAGHERHGDHPGAPAPHGSGARCVRGTPPPGQDPRSFLVRSASIALAAGEDWVDAVKPLVLVRPEQTLTLA